MQDTIRPTATMMGMGVLKVGDEGRITGFVEKPETEEEYAGFETPKTWWSGKAGDADVDCLLGSMGIYLFKTDVLVDAMEDSSNVDFGGDIIPKSIVEGGVYAFPFVGYWADIGTIRSFYRANLDLLETVPRFDFYNESAPIHTFRYPLPTNLRRSWNLAIGDLTAKGKTNII